MTAAAKQGDAERELELARPMKASAPTESCIEGQLVRQRKIITHFVYPPIPIRCFDWSAYFDDIGPEGPAGSGETEAAAVADLLAQVED